MNMIAGIMEMLIMYTYTSGLTPFRLKKLAPINAQATFLPICILDMTVVDAVTVGVLNTQMVLLIAVVQGVVVEGERQCFIEEAGLKLVCVIAEDGLCLCVTVLEPLPIGVIFCNQECTMCTNDHE